MGFYELSNGCDSCETVGPLMNNNINMQMDPNSSLVANMASPYGSQANTVKQYNGLINSGYVQTGTNMGSGGNGSNGSTMGGGQQTMQAMVVQTPPTIQQQVKQVTIPGKTMTLMVPTQNVDSVEGFSDDNSSTKDKNWIHNDKKWIVLGLVILCALASNECCKYFINKSLQLNDGSPLYYVAYAGLAILLAFAANAYASKK